jgi:hypothetical protein
VSVRKTRPKTRPKKESHGELTDEPCLAGQHEYTEVSRYEPLDLTDSPPKREKAGPRRIFCRKCGRNKVLPS